jgi:hypothetical protein
MSESKSTLHRQLFRKQPPKEFAEDILRAVGLSSGLDDLRWFSAEELRLDTQEAWLPQLEPYYLPCKARRFFEGRGELDGQRVITLLRHVLNCHGYCLKPQERMYKNKKATLYQIQPVDPFHGLDTKKEIEVSFE